MEELVIITVLCRLGRWFVRYALKIVSLAVLLGFAAWLIFSHFGFGEYLQNIWSLFLQYLSEIGF